MAQWKSLICEAPELRIISDDLWAAVQNRFTISRWVCRQFNKRGIVRDVQSNYLLSGLARCSHCGGPIESLGKDYARRKGRTYGCAYHRKRGAKICGNALRINQSCIDDCLLLAIEAALDDQILAQAIEKALLQLRAGDSQRMMRRQALERELSVIDGHVRNLVDAITKGNKMAPLLTKLKAEETRKQEFNTELERLNMPGDVMNVDEARLKRGIHQRIIDAKGLLGCQCSEARQILRKLVDQPLQFEAFEYEGGGKGYKVTGKGSYLQLLPIPIVSPCMVSPTGKADGDTQAFTFPIELNVLVSP